jgi:hypothetical protein
MGIVAWIVLGLGACPSRQYADPRQEVTGPHHHLLIGVADALLGGWLATKLFHIHTLQGFFNLSTWLTAIAARLSCCWPTTWSPHGAVAAAAVARSAGGRTDDRADRAGPVRRRAGGEGTGTGIALIAIGAILRFAVAAGSHGLNVQVVGVVLMQVGLLGPMLSLLAWGPLNPGRRRDRLRCDDEAPPAVAGERRAYQDQPPM